MPGRIISVVAVALGLLLGSSVLLTLGGSARAFQQSSPAAGTACPATTAEENAAIVQRFYDEGWNQGRLEVLDEVLADGYVHHAPGTSAYLPVRQSPNTGQDDLAASIQEFRTDFPDLHFTIEDIVASEGAVAVRMVTTGTQADTLDAR